MTDRTTGKRRAAAEDIRELELIGSAAAEGGRIAMQYFSGANALDVRLKNGRSPVSAADLEIDEYLRRMLTKARPEYGWLSEESADAAGAARHSARRTFIVDPIDGTRAFIDGADQWCVSIAVVETGRAVAGVLVCPALATTYAAVRGGGATKDDTPIKVQTSGPALLVAAAKPVIDALNQRLGDSLQHHRHVPSLAYRLALVAEGRIDATIVKPKSHDWDIAAAGLILEEAGGRLCTLDGGEVSLNGRNVAKPALLAGRDCLLERMLGVVSEDTFG
ncbi:3'(2'),5'-bisphosphate nucleotidase CysQ [Oricola sp.]|uniref:3'(2'),5'-bisphosphate nucleotidase CysQ n=1 Tax=Oricola sp. TaxID=1979950 RepID=UPI003BAA1757